MTFTADLQGETGGLTGLLIIEARRRLRLGEPAVWSFAVGLDDRLRDLATLADLIDGGGSTIAVRGPDGALAPPLAVGPMVLAGADADPRRLCVVSAAPPPLPPRRRVLHAANFRELVRMFTAVAEMPTAVANTLSRVVLPDGPHACFVQDGEDDATLLARLLTQYSALQTDAALRGLVVTGVAAPPKKPARRLTWNNAGAYRRLNQFDARAVEFGAAADSTIEIDFGAVPGATTVHRTLRNQPFRTAEWQQWTACDPPLFLRPSGALIIGVEDRICPGSADRVVWDRRIETLPADASWPAGLFRSWIPLERTSGSGARELWNPQRSSGC